MVKHTAHFLIRVSFGLGMVMMQLWGPHSQRAKARARARGGRQIDARHTRGDG